MSLQLGMILLLKIINLRLIKIQLWGKQVNFHKQSEKTERKLLIYMIS